MTGKHQAHPEYKASELRWLGKIPRQWELIKSKYLFCKIQRELRPKDDIATTFRDGQVTLRSNRRTNGFTNSMSKCLVPDYAYLLISSEGVKVELSLESKVSTMDNLNTETSGKIRLPIPPEQEQRKILNYANRISFKYDQIESRAKRQVALLQERRTALISAAVTGKIDVRNWQAPEQNQFNREDAP